MGPFDVRAMQAYVSIGANHEFRLCEAVLVYRGGGDGAVASLHQVMQAENGIPYLTPGEALTTAFLRTLAQGLGAQLKPEILPHNVLARTPDMLVWWSRPRQRVVFIGGTDEEARKLNGLIFPHPALIFKVAGRDLFVRAVATSPRPSLKRPSRPLLIGTQTPESVPAVCACPTLLTSRRCPSGKTHSFNLNSHTPQARCALPITLKASLGCGEFLLARSGSQFST